MDNSLEIVDLYENKFMSLRKEIDKEELQKHIGKYIIVRSYVSKGLRDSINESIFILVEVTDKELKVTREENLKSILVIEYDRLIEWEVLEHNKEVIDKLKALNYDRNLLVDITNIYDKKLRVILYYTNEYKDDSLDETCELSFAFKYKINDTDYGYDVTYYPVGLIKNIEVIDSYNYNNIMKILKYAADYYDTKIERLTNPVNNLDEIILSKIIKLIRRIENINNDYIAQVLFCNYNFIDESLKLVSDKNITNKIRIKYDDIEYYLDNVVHKKEIKNNLSDILDKDREFFRINNKIDVNKLKKSIGSYLLIRKKEYKRLVDYLNEKPCILIKVKDSSIIVEYLEENREEEIPFNRIKEIEVLVYNEEVIKKINSLDFDTYNYTFEITNIYDKKHKVRVYYITSMFEDELDESDTLMIDVIYDEEGNREATTGYPVGLIKSLEVTINKD